MHQVSSEHWYPPVHLLQLQAKAQNCPPDVQLL